MSKGNLFKSEMLGMNISTAQQRLRKSLLFKLVQETGKDICFRCKNKIEAETELSIEHKEAWQSHLTPNIAFFDYSNIAFSHLSCNIAAASRPHKKYANEEERRIARRPRRAELMRKVYSIEKRKEKYLSTGH